MVNALVLAQQLITAKALWALAVMSPPTTEAQALLSSIMVTTTAAA